MADSNYLMNDEAANGAVGNYVTVGDIGGVSDRTIYLAGAGAAAYHGWSRNRDWKWALVWGVLGGLSPLITNGIAIAQGYGKKK